MGIELVQKAVVKRGGKFLVMLRAPSAEHFPLHWDFPGGKLEQGEDAFTGIEREVLEETALEVKALDVVGVYNIELEDGPHSFTLYSTEILSGKVKISHEHLEYKWATKKEILKLKTEPYVELYFKEVTGF